MNLIKPFAFKKKCPNLEVVKAYMNFEHFPKMSFDQNAVIENFICHIETHYMILNGILKMIKRAASIYN